MPQVVKVAGVQLDIALGDPSHNLRRICDALAETASAGARITVFPECALTGYCFDSLEEALPHGEPLPGPSSEAVVAACRKLDVFCVFGLLESAGDHLFNACALAGPSGLIATYRKVHLPFLGVDRFTTAGDRALAVHAANDVRLGMNICYDSAFPESARVLALCGADLIVLPTNFPPGAENMVEFVLRTRAMENGVYYLAVNRVGTERGFRFIGQSKIYDVDGYQLASAPEADEAVLYADIDLELARNKQRVRVPEKHVIHRFDDRRPQMYGRLVEPT